MTAEEMFCALGDKYGDDFNWYMLPLSNKSFVTELKNEIGSDHFLYDKPLWAVAKCAATDDVLYVTADENGKDVYYIFHLTYSTQHTAGFPQYQALASIEAVKDFIEQSFVTDYL